METDLEERVDALEACFVHMEARVDQYGAAPFMVVIGLKDANGLWLHMHGKQCATAEEAEALYAVLAAGIGMDLVVAK